MEYQTIARTMGLSLGNVKTLIHRGKLALAHKMREREEAALGRSTVKSVHSEGPRTGLGHALLVF
jgi:hypothetical protein